MLGKEKKIVERNYEGITSAKLTPHEIERAIDTIYTDYFKVYSKELKDMRLRKPSDREPIFLAISCDISSFPQFEAPTIPNWNIVAHTKTPDWMELSYSAGGITDHRFVVTMQIAYKHGRPGKTALESKARHDITVFGSVNTFTKKVSKIRSENSHQGKHTTNCKFMLKREQNPEFYDMMDVAIHLNLLNPVFYIEEVNDYKNNEVDTIVSPTLPKAMLIPHYSLFSNKVFTNRKIYTNHRPNIFIVSKDIERDILYIEWNVSKN